MSAFEYRDTSRGSSGNSPSALRASLAGNNTSVATQGGKTQTGPAIVLDERKMYTVDWRDSATFGFTVTPVNSDRGTVLLLAKRTAPASALEAAGLHEVLPGDMLVAIGDERVYHLGAEHATRYLRSVRKPVRLTLQLSPFGGSGKNIPDLAPNEYDYMWESGPLGLVLTPDPKSKIPVVKRINLEKIADPSLLKGVAVGDELIYANDIATCEHSMGAIIKIIRDLPKPILLRFRKPLKEHLNAEVPELRANEYDFLWEYGSLGLVVGEARSGLPFVRSFTGKGTSRQLGLVQANDEIVMVNDRSAELMGFAETMDYILNMPKPAVLRFRRQPPMVAAADDSAAVAMASLRISNEQQQPPAPIHMQQTQQQQHLAQLQPRKTTKPELRDLSYPQSPPHQTVVSPPYAAPIGAVSSSVSPPQVSGVLGYSAAERQSSASDRRSTFTTPKDDPSTAALAVNNNSDDYFAIDQTAFYQIQWTDGPFGLTVREAMSKLGAVMLITKRTGKATCAGLKRVAVGDILVRVGDRNVGELGFDAATRFLRTVQKPVVLTFQAID